MPLWAISPPPKLYDIAKEEIKSSLEQVNDVGNVTIIGGSRREIQVEIDRDKMNLYDLSAITIANKIRGSGSNVPSGKFEKGEKETVFRAIGQFEKFEQIENIPILFGGDVGSGVTLKTIATVRDGTENDQTRSFLYAAFQPEKNGEKRGFFNNDAGTKTEKSGQLNLPFYWDS